MCKTHEDASDRKLGGTDQKLDADPGRDTWNGVFCGFRKADIADQKSPKEPGEDDAVEMDFPLNLDWVMGKGESILIVDDVKEQRDLATEMLEKLNYNLSSVASGEAAVEYLKDHPCDLLILDQMNL